MNCESCEDDFPLEQMHETADGVWLCDKCRENCCRAFAELMETQPAQEPA